MLRMFGRGTTVTSGDDPVLRSLDGRTS